MKEVTQMLNTSHSQETQETHLGFFIEGVLLVRIVVRSSGGTILSEY